MSIEVQEMVVDGMTVQVVRKEIKNLHLGVYPPNGRVRVAAPLRVSDDAVRLAVVGWAGSSGSGRGLRRNRGNRRGRW